MNYNCTTYIYKVYIYLHFLDIETKTSTNNSFKKDKFSVNILRSQNISEKFRQKDTWQNFSQDHTFWIIE